MCIRNITYRFREATYVRSNLSNTKKTRNQKYYKSNLTMTSRNDSLFSKHAQGVYRCLSAAMRGSLSMVWSSFSPPNKAAAW